MTDQNQLLRDALEAFDAFGEADDVPTLLALTQKMEAIRSALTAQPAEGGEPTLSKDQIREVFLSHGFTIKEGQTDLKPYVYDAAYALIALVQTVTERKGEPVATVRTIRGVTIGYLETMLPDGTPLYTSPQVPEDTALLDFMEERRVSLIPEYEGPWAARQYDDDPQFAADAEGATPRDALRALFDAARKGE